MNIRSFLAFELPDSIRDTLAGLYGEMRRYPVDPRWVRPGNIHLTVVFLGEVPEADLGPIQKAAANTCRQHPSFRLAMEGTGVFSSIRRPRVLWAGLKGDLEGMGLFKRDLEEALEPLGFEPEKRGFRPHLTLGRFRRGRKAGDIEGFLTKFEKIRSDFDWIRELVLFRSDLEASGAVYTRMDAWPLSSDS